MGDLWRQCSHCFCGTAQLHNGRVCLTLLWRVYIPNPHSTNSLKADFVRATGPHRNETQSVWTTYLRRQTHSYYSKCKADCDECYKWGYKPSLWKEHFLYMLFLCRYLCLESESVSHSVTSVSLQPMNCSPPGSSVHGILQARIVEYVAIPFSRGSSQPGDQTQVSCIAGRVFTIWDTLAHVIWPPSPLHDFKVRHLHDYCWVTYSVIFHFHWHLEGDHVKGH